MTKQAAIRKKDLKVLYVWPGRWRKGPQVREGRHLWKQDRTERFQHLQEGHSPTDVMKTLILYLLTFRSIR